MAPAIRIVRGVRLFSNHPGFWALESNPTILFQKMLGDARLGARGARYSVERWIYPGSDGSSQSLDAAVRRYLAGRFSGRAHMDKAMPTFSNPMIIDGPAGKATLFYIPVEDRDGWPPVYRVQVRTTRTSGTNAKDFSTQAEAEAWAQSRLQQQQRRKRG